MLVITKTIKFNVSALNENTLTKLASQTETADNKVISDLLGLREILHEQLSA